MMYAAALTTPYHVVIRCGGRGRVSIHTICIHTTCTQICYFATVDHTAVVWLSYFGTWLAVLDWPWAILLLIVRLTDDCVWDCAMVIRPGNCDCVWLLCAPCNYYASMGRWLLYTCAMHMLVALMCWVDYCMLTDWWFDGECIVMVIWFDDDCTLIIWRRDVAGLLTAGNSYTIHIMWFSKRVSKVISCFWWLGLTRGPVRVLTLIR